MTEEINVMNMESQQQQQQQQQQQLLVGSNTETIINQQELAAEMELQQQQQQQQQQQLVTPLSSLAGGAPSSLSSNNTTIEEVGVGGSLAAGGAGGNSGILLTSVLPTTSAVAHQPPTLSGSGGAAAPPAPSAFSYDDLFPALPTNNAPSSNIVVPGCVRVSSTQMTQVLRVPVEERISMYSEKFGEGESKRICQMISKETGAQIEFVNGKDQSLSFLIKGKEKQITDARCKILLHFSTQSNKTITIPKEHHRIILGKRGDRLREIECNSATRINIPHQNDDSDIITISGTPKGIIKAEQEIRQLSAEQCKKSSERIVIPKSYHPFIVGPYNTNLNKIMEETSAKVSVPPPSTQKDDIVIQGDKESIALAKAKIEEIYQEKKSKCSLVSVEVAKAQHRYVIGPKGSTIAEILQLTGVSVEMPPSDSPSETITLFGPQEALGNALTAVYQKANSVKSLEIDAPHWVHKYVIGRKGVNVKQLEDECPNVNVNCLEDKIKLEGDPENVDKAANYLNDIIRNYVENYTYTVLTVNPAHYKHIIGRAGANVLRLKDELNVNLRKEEIDGHSSIRIEGPKEGVLKATQELQEKIDKLDNEKSKDVIIDRRFHRQIIGTKGEKIKELKERYKQVNISIPAPNENTDIIKLRGPKDDVDRCHKDLMKIVKDIKEAPHILELPIFKQFHKHITNKTGGGAVALKKIREDTETTIDLPATETANGSGGGVGGGTANCSLVITGKKENVFEAKERLLKLQKDAVNVVTDELQIPIKHFSYLRSNNNSRNGSKLLSSIVDECGGVSIKLPQYNNNNSSNNNYASGAMNNNDDNNHLSNNSNSNNNELSTDKVVFQGPKDDVEKAKKQLLEVINERELSSFTAEVRANYNYHKFLIGKNGSSVRKIRESTGARIIFPNYDDLEKEIITIIGKKEAVQQAKEQLETILNEIVNVTEEEITVDPKYHKHFVAKRGEMLHRISEECGGVSISFPRVGTDSDKVIIKGAKDCIAAAKQRIFDTVQDFESYVTIEVVIPQRLHRNFLSKGGYKVQQVSMDHNVQIKFPDRFNQSNEKENNNNNNNNGNNESLTNGSTTTAVATESPSTQSDGAEEHQQNNGNEAGEINSMDVSNTTTSTTEAGETSESSSPTSVRQCDIIRITGRHENCMAAKQALIDQMPITEEVNVPYSLHRTIIGPKGMKVRQFMNTYNVYVGLPPSEIKSDLIKLTGTSDCVNDAKNALQKMIDEYELEKADREARSFTLQFEVDPEYYSKLIGKRGVVIGKLRSDYDVNISLPKREDENQRLITIVGYKENALKAQAAIMSIVDELRDMKREVIEVDYRIHSHLIGARGRTIKKIITDNKVDIKFPTAEEAATNPDAITIIGKEEDIENAKEEILNLAEDYMRDYSDNVTSLAAFLPPNATTGASSATSTASTRTAGGASAGGSASANANNNAANANSENGGFVLKNAPWENANDHSARRSSSSSYHKQHKYNSNSGGSGNNNTNSSNANVTSNSSMAAATTVPDTDSQKDFPRFANLKNANASSAAANAAATVTTTPIIPSVWGQKH